MKPATTPPVSVQAEQAHFRDYGTVLGLLPCEA